MPEAESGVGDTDAAPGTNAAMPESERPTLSSASEAPTTEAVVEAVATTADEWDEPASDAAQAPEPDGPALDPGAFAAPEVSIDESAEPGVPDGEPTDAFATGVLEIVSALDEDAPAPVADAVPTETSGEADTEPAQLAETPADDVGGDGAAAVDTEAVADAPGDAVAGPAAELVVAPVATAEPEAEPASGRVPWWPFAIYLGLWVAGLGYAAYRLLQVPPGQALYEHALYGYFMLGGLVLTALGPILIPFIWLLARSGLEKSQRGGLFARTAFWGALATLLGVGLWWVTIIVLDAVRLGTPL
jgi:hypothetical protein